MPERDVGEEQSSAADGRMMEGWVGIDVSIDDPADEQHEMDSHRTAIRARAIGKR